MANIFGTNGNNILIGTAAADSILGFDGSDLLEGGLGADTIDGGSGQDTVSYFDNAGVTVRLDQGFAIDAGGSTDVLIGIEDVNGSNSNDIIVGTTGRNIIQALGGDDFIEGRNGTINGDIIDGGQGNDTVSYITFLTGVVVNLDLDAAETGGITDQLFNVENAEGGQGNDFLIGDAGINLLRGLGGSDRLEGGAGGDLLEGRAGSDLATYRFSSVGVLVDLRSGIALFGDAQGDVLSSIEALEGSNGNDSLGGSNAANLFFGGNGDDYLAGYIGRDVLDGGFGNDTIEGGRGKDTIDGGDGNDLLSGDEGLLLVPGVGDASADLLRGGAGDDTMLGGLGGDSMIGGSGFDLADYRRDAAGVLVDLRSNVAVFGEAAGDLLIDVEALRGGTGNDSLGGTETANGLDGGNGNDYLAGYGGNDTFFGGDGNDTIECGTGDDLATGGAGIDTFGWIVAAEGRDTITDFASGIDTLRIDASGFGGGLVAGENFAATGRLVFGANATQATGQFLYNQASGDLTWDANGTAAGGRLLLVTLDPGNALASGDFVVVA